MIHATFTIITKSNFDIRKYSKVPSIKCICIYLDRKLLVVLIKQVFLFLLKKKTACNNPNKNDIYQMFLMFMDICFQKGFFYLVVLLQYSYWEIALNKARRKEKNPKSSFIVKRFR